MLVALTFQANTFFKRFEIFVIGLKIICFQNFDSKKRRKMEKNGENGGFAKKKRKKRRCGTTVNILSAIKFDSRLLSSREIYQEIYRKIYESVINADKR